MKTKKISFLRKLFFLLFMGLVLFPAFGKAPVLTEKQISEVPPRIIRTCCAFGTDLHMAVFPFVKYSKITSISEIGEHHYLGNKNEGNGNIYTQRGGFIDLGHLRDCADWTAYLYNRINASRENPGLEVTELGNEGGKKTLFLEIPDDFDSLAVYDLAAKIAYDLSVWHEMATWYGASYVPLIPERYSSFSPEDLYSNLLGVHLAVKAMQSNLDYDSAMTKLISETLDSLGAFSTKPETYNAMREVEDVWWSAKKPLPSKKILLKHYLGSGYSLSPWLLPETENKIMAYRLEKPNKEMEEFYQLEIKLNYKFPVKKIFGKSSNRIITQLNFGDLFRQIQKEINLFEYKTNFQNIKKEMRIEKRNKIAV